MLNLYKLKVFMTIIEAGNFSKAANRMYLTQSAVSQHIRDLEHDLGVKLFIRGRQGVTLTDTGITLYQYTTQILRLVAEAENAVTNVSNLTNGQIIVGATPGISVYLLPDWVQTFRQQYPRLTISTQTDITAAILNDLQNRKLNLGFIEGELDTLPAPLRALDLQTIPHFVVIGIQHPWHQRETIATAELPSQPFIMRQPGSQTRIWIESMLATCGCHPHIVAEFDSPDAIKKAIINGMGISILPEYTIQQERQLGLLKALSITDLKLERTLKLVWDNRQPHTPITLAFLQSLRERYPQIGGEALNSASTGSIRTE